MHTCINNIQQLHVCWSESIYFSVNSNSTSIKHGENNYTIMFPVSPTNLLHINVRHVQVHRTCRLDEERFGVAMEYPCNQDKGERAVHHFPFL